MCGHLHEELGVCEGGLRRPLSNCLPEFDTWLPGVSTQRNLGYKKGLQNVRFGGWQGPKTFPQVYKARPPPRKIDGSPGSFGYGWPQVTGGDTG